MSSKPSLRLAIRGITMIPPAARPRRQSRVLLPRDCDRLERSHVVNFMAELGDLTRRDGRSEPSLGIAIFPHFFHRWAEIAHDKESQNERHAYGISLKSSEQSPFKVVTR